MKLRKGLELIDDRPGDGAPLRRLHVYRLRIRMWLSRGDPVRWSAASGFIGSTLEDGGATLVTITRIDRRSLMSGLFYGVEGMRIGGTRAMRIAPHLAYGADGVPGVVPGGAVLRVEVTALEEVEFGPA